MEKYVFLVFFLLCISLILSVFRKHRQYKRIKLIRYLIVVGATVFYSFWFLKGSVEKFSENLLEVQVINKLPQTLDFYVLKVIDKKKSSVDQFKENHAGKVRPEHYRVEYLNMKDSDEFWIVGFLSKKEIVYFSQHSVPEGLKLKQITINNYINQSQKLSGQALKVIEDNKMRLVSRSIWIALGLLLIFLNWVLLMRKRG